MVDLSRATWRKSTRSGYDGCVQVAFVEGRVAFGVGSGTHRRAAARGSFSLPSSGQSSSGQLETVSSTFRVNLPTNHRHTW